jgi:energy-coupling factor transport system permease protein
VVAPEGADTASDVPPFLAQSSPGAFHRLNPLTKLVLATVTAAVAIALGGIVGPVAILVFAVLVPAWAARVLTRLLRTSLLLSLPIGLSALLVNVFFFPGGQEVLLRLGPFTATAEGLTFALQILARILAISGGITLFYLTTRSSDLVVDLERRGVSQRVAFVANASVQTVPAMVERASAIIAAQRARGLDTEGSIWRRVRGIVPIVAPVILGSIGEVEERTVALEARGFTRPGRRTLLWAPSDSSWQRALRWGLITGAVLLLVARSAGWLHWLPGIG